MTNNVLTTAAIAEVALANLYESTVMLPLIYRNYENEFQPGRGATITVRVPTRFVSHEFTGAITIQNANETGIPFVLNHHRDVSFSVTSRDMASNINNFNEQFMQPAMQALVEDIDRDILALRSDVSQAVGQAPYTHWNDPKTLVDARTVLSKAKAPLAGRVVVVGPDMSGEWLKSDSLFRFDASGDTVALSEASLGTRKAGFTPYETQNITDNTGVAFIPTAFAVAFRPLDLPAGAASAVNMDYNGISIRVVRDYDITTKTEVISLDVLYGLKTLAPDRAVLIDGQPS